MIHGNWARPQFAPQVSDNVDHMNNNLTTAITAFQFIVQEEWTVWEIVKEGPNDFLRCRATKSSTSKTVIWEEKFLKKFCSGSNFRHSFAFI